jgi:hypothetical protein
MFSGAADDSRSAGCGENGRSSYALRFWATDEVPQTVSVYRNLGTKTHAVYR